MGNETNKLVIVISKGIESEQSSVALTLANGGLTSGLSVSLFLTSTGNDPLRKS